MDKSLAAVKNVKTPDLSSIPTWMYWVIGILVAVVLIFLVVLPFLRKIRRKQIKVKETTEIKKDLMIWHHLAQLVRGGSAHQKAKKVLSDQIANIDIAFEKGMKMLSDHNRNVNNQPCYLIVGEPMSGKSTLLRNSEQELVVSKEEERDEESNKGEALRLWMGAKSLTYDIGGHIFFDRWMEGSSAEWSYIAKIISKKRRKKPLDGVILTIPADALLADDDGLTQQKAVLMSTELGQLLHTLGMYMPCYVVVTKTDMVNGFSEYMMSIAEDLRSQIFGWVNDDPKARYDVDKFNIFWKDLLYRLRKGCAKNMISKNVTSRLTGYANKMEINGKIFVFPDNFAKMYKNISTYLKAIFGEGNYYGAGNALFEGLFFTSAVEGDFTLSPDLAMICEQKIDDMPVVHEHKMNSKPLFIKDLLQKVIFKNSVNAAFTQVKKAKLNIPKYVACFCMLLIGGLWAFRGVSKNVDFETALQPKILYLQTLTDMMKSGGVFNSPLIKKTEEGQYVLNSDPVENMDISRLHFFFEAFTERESKIVAPFGFKLASLFVFGFEKSMGYDDFAIIINQLFGFMIRTPLIKLVGDKIDSEGTNAHLTVRKKGAVASYSLLNEVRFEDFTDLFADKKAFDVSNMMYYLMPEISADTINILDAYLPQYDEKYTGTFDSTYLYTEDYSRSLKKGVSSILNSWNDLTAYPSSSFSKIRTLIKNTRLLESSYADINHRVNVMESAQSLEELTQQINSLVDLLKEQENRTETIILTYKNLLSLTDTKKIDVSKEESKSMGTEDLAVRMLLNKATDEYKNHLKTDFSFLIDNADELSSEEFTVSDIRKSLPRIRKNILIEIDAKKKEMSKGLNDFRNKPLLQWQFVEKEGASNYTYHILYDGYKYLDNLEIPTRAKLLENDFRTNWSRANRSIRDVNADFEDFMEIYSKSENLKPQLDLMKRVYDLFFALIKYSIVDTELSKLPETVSELYSYVEQKSEENQVFGFTEDLARETMGDLRYLKGYDPKEFSKTLGDLFKFAHQIMNAQKSKTDKNNEKDKQQQISQLFTKEFQHYKKSLEVFEGYLDDYIRYWGGYSDRVYVPAKDWHEFKVRLKVLKAYKINSLLQQVYSQCLTILKSVDESLISDHLKQKKKALLDLLSDKISIMTPLFTDAGEKTLLGWSELPNSSEQAWEQISSTSDATLKETLFNVYSKTPRSKISWWNEFIDNGIALLKHENEKRIENNYVDLIKSMNMFPLCKNCQTKGVINVNDMKKLTTLLSSSVSVPKAKEDEESGNDSKEELFDRKLNLFKDLKTIDWAKEILTVAKQLQNTKKPLSWTLYQAGVENQTGLLEENELSAINRFRYVEVVTGKKTKRYSTAAMKDSAIGRGKAEDKLIINFYKYSTDTKPEISLRYNTTWAIFKIYLANGAISDPAEDKVYIPLNIVDKDGTKYKYFVTVKFNNEILKADEWPTKKNWNKK
ncbi:MAG: type VI secretion system protein [Alphaproteobacteria bacterium]|nr:type VI secretion system protein [Alphaproteobacteria bacterium]